MLVSKSELVGIVSVASWTFLSAFLVLGGSGVFAEKPLPGSPASVSLLTETRAAIPKGLCSAAQCSGGPGACPLGTNCPSRYCPTCTGASSKCVFDPSYETVCQISTWTPPCCTLSTTCVLNGGEQGCGCSNTTVPASFGTRKVC
jgi:hypothetical protein